MDVRNSVRDKLKNSVAFSGNAQTAAVRLRHAFKRHARRGVSAGGGAFTVELIELRIANNRVPADRNTYRSTIIDSGTTFMYLPPTVRAPADALATRQKQLFGGALSKGGALNVWYGHLHTSVWIQSELPEGFEEQMAALNLARTYKESGWCFVEAAISEGLKVGDRRLDQGMRPEGATGYFD